MNKLKVLVVEDDQDMANLLQQQIEAEGCSVTLAVNYGDGVEQFDRVLPDLVIFDINLPDGNGVDLLGQLKQGEHPFTAAMLTSGQAAPVIAAALTRGAIAYLHKPMLPGELDVVLETARQEKAGRDR